MAVKKKLTPTNAFLQDKIVKVQVLEKNPSPTIIDEPGGSERFMLQGTSVSFQCQPIPQRDGGNGSFTDIFANEYVDEDDAYNKGRKLQADLESLLGYAPGDLDPRIKPTEDIVDHILYKQQYRITLTKTRADMESASISLNLAKPNDFLKYLICKSSSLCAPSWEDRFRSTKYVAAIVDETDVLANTFDRDESKGEIFHKIYSLTYGKPNQPHLYAIYSLFRAGDNSFKPTIKIDISSDIKAIYNQLLNAIEGEKITTKRLALLKSIVEKTPKEFDNHIMFHKAIASRQVIKEGFNFTDKNHELIGPSEAEVIKWLNAPEQSSLKLAFMSDKA